MAKIQQNVITETLYLGLRSLYHYEREIETEFGLNFSQVYALQHLRRHSPLNLNQIAVELNIPMFSASRMIDALVKKNLVEKHKGRAADGRCVTINLLPAGEKITQEIEKSSYERVTAHTTGLSDSEAVQLLNFIEKFHVFLGVTEKVIK